MFSLLPKGLSPSEVVDGYDMAAAKALEILPSKLLSIFDSRSGINEVVLGKISCTQS